MSQMDYQPGDVLVFSGRASLSWGIRAGTCSRYSHGAVVAEHRMPSDDADETVLGAIAQSYDLRPLLFESTTMINDPCIITGKCINGVQAHYPQVRVNTYNGRVWLMRLVEPMNRAESRLLTLHLLDKLGTAYDGGGALLAGTMLLKRGILAPRAADRSSVFCIEYVLDALTRALKKRKLPQLHPGRQSPRSMVRVLVRNGLYRPPLRIK